MRLNDRTQVIQRHEHHIESLEVLDAKALLFDVCMVRDDRGRRIELKHGLTCNLGEAFSTCAYLQRHNVRDGSVFLAQLRFKYDDYVRVVT